MAASSLIGNLAVNLRMETAAFEAGAKRARAQTTALQRSMSKVGTGLKVLGAGLVAGLSLSTITNVVTSALEYASSLGEVAQQLGVTTSELQRYRFIASQVGIEQSEMDKGLSFLSRTLGDLAMGAKAPAKALAQLGFNAEAVARISKMSAGEAIPVLADAFAKLESPAKASALAADLFGAKLGGKFLTLLMGGSAGINALAESYKKLGIEMTPEQIAKADEAADKFAALKKVLEAKIAGFVADNAQTIINVADGLSRLAASASTAADKFGGYLDTVGSKLAAADKGLVSFAARIAEVDRKLGIPPPKAFFDGLGKELIAAGGRWDAFAAKVSGFAARFDAEFVRLATVIGASITRIAVQVQTWLIDKLNQAWDRATRKIQEVGDKFKWLYDVVVGHSYVPDMVTAIGEHMRRLDAEMVTPARTAAERTAEAFAKLQALLARLFPEEAAHNAFLADIATLDDALKRGKISADEYAAALTRLKSEGMGDERTELEGADYWADQFENDVTGRMDEEYDEFADSFMGKMVKPTEDGTARMIESFAYMATSVIGSLRGMVSAFKSGDILGGLLQLLQVVGQVAAQFGAFKGGGDGGFQPSNTMSFGGFRARGGPAVSGKSYIVGEHGPEWFTPSTAGRITPSNDNGGIAQIVPSPLFEVVIDGRVVRTATPLAEGAAHLGSARAESKIYRRQARTFP